MNAKLVVASYAFTLCVMIIVSSSVGALLSFVMMLLGIKGSVWWMLVFSASFVVFMGIATKYEAIMVDG